MAQKTLLPCGYWQYLSGITGDYSAVDEDPANDGDYLSTGSDGVEGKAVFSLTPLFYHGVISDVTIIARVRTDHGSGSSAQIYRLYPDGNSAEYANISFGDTAWHNISISLGALSLNDLSRQRFGVSLHAPSGWHTFCSQIKAVVTYTPWGSDELAVVLIPIGPGDETGITSQYPASGSHYDKIDDPTPGFPDDNGTYLTTQSTSYVRDLYDLSYQYIPGHIKAIVLVSITGSSNGDGGRSQSVLKTGGGLYYGSENLNPNASYAYICGRFIDVWTTNPATGVAWAQADLDALQAGAQIHQRSGGWNIRLTQLVAVVFYDSNRAPAVPNTPSGPSYGVNGLSLQFSTSGTDPDGDQVKYEFDFDDGSGYVQTGFVASGQSASVNHIFNLPEHITFVLVPMTRLERYLTGHRFGL